MGEDSDPLGDGETVYATEPSEDTPREDGVDDDKPKHHRKEWLHRQYHILGKTQKEIAEIADVHKTTITNHMQKHGLETRDRNVAISLSKGGDELLWDEEWLREQYVELEKTTIEMAEDRDVCKNTVSEALGRFGIETRGEEEAQKKAFEEKYSDRKYNDKDWLKHQYVTLGKGTPTIAEGNGWSNGTVRRALISHGIGTRTERQAALTRHERERLKESGADNRELISKGGIDASWRYFHERPAADKD